VTANANGDGSLGEVFATSGKQGSTTAGLLDLLSIAISLGLQHGVPLQTFVAAFTDQRFEPLGTTDDPDVPSASSVGDYLARRLAHDWLDLDTRKPLDLLTAEEETALPAGAYAPTPLHSRKPRSGAAGSGGTRRTE
jgi:ribonucleoside-diphosphate reductase alpha chain